MKKLSKQDRNGVRTALDLERKYRFKNIGENKKNIENLEKKTVVDSELSATSNNAVQNKVITNELNEINNSLIKKVSEEEVQNMIENSIKDITQFDYNIVENLPEVGQKGIIYLIQIGETEFNLYDKYIYVNNTWEILSKNVDMSNFLEYTYEEIENIYNSEEEN